MNNWNLLNIKLKAAYIKLAVAKGIRTLADVITDYENNDNQAYLLDISGDYYKYMPKKNKFDGWENSTMDLANDQYHYIALQEAEKKRLNTLRNIQFYWGKNKPLPNSLFWLLNNPGVEIVGAGSKSNPVRLPDVNVIGLSAATRAYNAQLPYLNNLDIQELYRTEVNKADAKARRINEGWENLVLGGWAMPSQFIGAVLRNNPWTSLGYGKGNGFFQDWLVGNGGVTTDNFNAEHPYLSAAANLGFDMFTPAIIGKLRSRGFNTKVPDFSTRNLELKSFSLKPFLTSIFKNPKLTREEFHKNYDLLVDDIATPINSKWGAKRIYLKDFPEVTSYLDSRLERLSNNRIAWPLTVDLLEAFPEMAENIWKYYDPVNKFMSPKLDKNILTYVKNNIFYPDYNLDDIFRNIKIHTLNKRFWKKYNSINNTNSAAFYKFLNESIALNKKFSLQDIIHELRHHLDNWMGIPLNSQEKDILIKAYRPEEFTKNYKNYPYINYEMVTTNAEACYKLLKNSGKIPKTVKELNAIIDSATLSEIEEALQCNGYGVNYVREINKLPTAEKNMLLENARQAMKYVGVGTGVGLGITAANGLNINKYGGSLSKMKKNNNYAKGGYLRLLAINNFFKKYANKFDGKDNSTISRVDSPQLDAQGYPLPLRLHPTVLNGVYGVDYWGNPTYNNVYVDRAGNTINPQMLRDYNYMRSTTTTNYVKGPNGTPKAIAEEAMIGPQTVLPEVTAKPLDPYKDLLEMAKYSGAIRDQLLRGENGDPADNLANILLFDALLGGRLSASILGKQLVNSAVKGLKNTSERLAARLAPKLKGGLQKASSSVKGALKKSWKEGPTSFIKDPVTKKLIDNTANTIWNMGKPLVAGEGIINGFKYAPVVVGDLKGEVAPKTGFEHLADIGNKLMGYNTDPTDYNYELEGNDPELPPLDAQSLEEIARLGLFIRGPLAKAYNIATEAPFYNGMKLFHKYELPRIVASGAFELQFYDAVDDGTVDRKLSPYMYYNAQPYLNRVPKMPLQEGNWFDLETGRPMELFKLNDSTKETLMKLKNSPTLYNSYLNKYPFLEEFRGSEQEPIYRYIDE